MDAQKSEKSIYTEWVKCPYCHEVIKAPNQPDMTFLCPNCCKELITYDKKKEIEQLKEEKKNKQTQLLWSGLTGLIIIIAIIFYIRTQDHKNPGAQQNKQSLSYNIPTIGTTDNKNGTKWHKIKEWHDLSYGDGGKYILYQEAGNDDMMIEFVQYDAPLSFPCKKYTIQHNNEFLCHEPFDTPGGGRGDFYLAKGSTIYIIQNVGNNIDAQGEYQVIGLLVMTRENVARIFMNDSQNGRNYFMLYAALGS